MATTQSIGFAASKTSFLGGASTNDLGSDLLALIADYNLQVGPNKIAPGAVTPSSITLANDKILVGNSSGIATAVTMSGDITITNTGVTAIGAGKIVNSEVNASAAIDFSKLAALTSANILVGNGSNVATSVAMSGDTTISNAGAVTIGDGKVKSRMLNLTIDQNSTAGSKSTTSSTFANVTNASVSLTPAVTSNVMLTVSGRYFIGSVLQKTLSLQIIRDSTLIGTALSYDSPGSVTNDALPFSFSFLDKSVASGGHVYQLQILSVDNTTTVNVDTVYIQGFVTAA